MTQLGSESPVAEIALAFAHAAVAGDFGAAHAMLSRELAARLGPDDLAREYAAMLEYCDDRPDLVELVQADDMDGWQTWEAGDVGWAYVAICGPDYSEAVSVVVARDGDRHAIRSVEWGRP